MGNTFLASAADIQWLTDVHLAGLTLPAFAVAELFGNESYPSSIRLYERDHYQSAFWVYMPDDDGQYTLMGSKLSGEVAK